MPNEAGATPSVVQKMIPRNVEVVEAAASVTSEVPPPATPDPAPKARTMDSGMEAHDLRRRTVRGGLFSVIGQGATVFLRTGSMIVIARLVTPEQFGLVGMVTAFTGFLALFRDVGLSMATIQRPTITHEQTSTLFWINLAAGALLTALCLAMAPVLAVFYKEPRLLWVTVALGAGFLFYGASAQHRALLQRKMYFGRLVLVDTVSLLLSIVGAIAAAMAGMGYWALVIMAISQPVMGAVGTWFAAGWVPGRPTRGSGVRSMMRFGGVITLNSFIVYLAYNAEKILLGRFWGAEVLGIYGRAYQLINLPTENLNTVMGQVMFPALSRIQDDPARFRTYFLKGYGLFLAMVLPVTVACALFADDIVRVLLGPQWTSTVPVFRLLAPTILAFALINPMAWLMQASGRVNRSLQISFLIAPVVVIGYLVGLPYGSKGVAFGFSAAMILLVVPVVQWAKHGTSVTTRDMLRTAMHPLISIVAGSAVALGVNWLMADVPSALLRLCVVSAVLFASYAVVLLFVLGEKQTYLDLLRVSGVGRNTASASKGRGVTGAADNA